MDSYDLRKIKNGMSSIKEAIEDEGSQSRQVNEEILKQQKNLVNIFTDLAAAIRENTEETRALRKELSPKGLNKKKKTLTLQKTNTGQ